MPRTGYTMQSMRFTHKGIVAEAMAARRKRIVHAPVIIMLVSRKRLVDHTSGGVFLRAMIRVHGRLIRIEASDNADNEPKMQVVKFMKPTIFIMLQVPASSPS
jgi:hypothetical protein